MKARTRNLCSLLFNLLIVISTVLAVGIYFVGGPDALGSTGTGCFRYFTTDSNVLAAIASFAMLFYNFRALKDPEAHPSRALMLFKFVATVSVAITFITVVLFLGPTAALRGGLPAYLRFFAGNTFALHFSTPVLSILSVVLFERTPELSRRDLLWALLPTVVYSIVYLILVVFLRRWWDWYGFTFGGKYALAPVSMAVMYLVTLGVAALLRRMRAPKKKVTPVT